MSRINQERKYFITQYILNRAKAGSLSGVVGDNDRDRRLLVRNLGYMYDQIVEQCTDEEETD